MSGIATVAVPGLGFTLSVVTGTSPIVTTTIGQLKEVKRSGAKTKMINITCTSSPRIGTGLIYEETMPIMIGPGDIDFSGIFNPGDLSQISLQTMQDAGTLGEWTIELPLNPANTALEGHWTFAAYVSDLSTSLSFDKEISFSGKLSITGPPVFTPGS
jgi:hypothetical protein